MTLEELYARVDGNYEEVRRRLPTEGLVEMFILKFLDDTTCTELIAAWEAGDERGCFSAAHTAKGLCANLSLTRLATLSSDICEALREGNEDLRAQTDVDALVSQLKEAYAATVDAISTYSAEK